LKEQFMTPRREGTVRVVGKTAYTPKASTPKASTPRKEPNFQPYSQEHFLARLKTFADVKKWTTKPDAINEVEWAMRGWSCDIWNTVACKGGCENRVAVKLRPKRKDASGRDLEMSEDLAVDVDNALVERYKDLIIEGHAEDCLWRKRGCQGMCWHGMDSRQFLTTQTEDIYHIPIASRAKSTTELLDRYRSLKAIAADLPLLEHITYPDPSIRRIIERIPSTFFTSAPNTPQPTSQSDVVAFAFALFGWAGVSESRISLAVCNHCFQRLGLWLSSGSRLQEMSQKLDVPVESLRLNLVESHREHCPWKNADAQGNSKDGPIANMAAWQTLQFMLLGRHKDAFSSSSATAPLTPQKQTPRKQHGGHTDSVDLDGELEYPRGSMDSVERPKYNDEDEEGGLKEKWIKLKAKLKRSASKKSMKSTKSGKSGKSIVTKEK
jgi:hypothetical protein